MLFWFQAGSKKNCSKWTWVVLITLTMTGVVDGHVNMTSRRESTTPVTVTVDNITEYDEMTNMTDEEYTNFLVEYITPQKSEWVFIILHSMVFVVGLIGNALVCVAVYR